MVAASANQIYKIKVSLEDIRPPIWRRILVRGNTTLSRLHDILQVVMGWEDYHLHQFIVDDQYYGIPEDDEFGLVGVKSEKRCKLNQLIKKPGFRFKYEYDFGDGWVHTLLVEEILSLEKGRRYPVCLKGKRACPPEDVGGPWGYENFLEALNNSAHPEHEQYVDWIGGEFDPEEFDLELVNEQLQQVGKRKEQAWMPEIDSEILEESSTLLAAFEQWIRQLDPGQIAIAENLPLRKDSLALLTYLSENKVVGTQATGNLPLKSVREITARFVEPPQLDETIGDHIYRLRSEEDVWPLYFLHIITAMADLIEGGNSRRWKLTPQGELFLEFPAPLQVLTLLLAWWAETNWLIAFPFEGMGFALPSGFEDAALKQLLTLKPGESVNFGHFADRLIQTGKLAWHAEVQDHALDMLHIAVEHMIVDPLKKFGVVEADYKLNEKYGWKDIQDIRLTTFGKGLLEILRLNLA